MRVSVPLSQFARPFLIDPAAFQKTLQHPLLVWETPPLEGEVAVLTTFGGVPWERPKASEPTVYQVTQGRARAHRSVVVGRSSTCDIVILDGSVSSEHAGIQYQDESKSWWVIDNGSKNGTWVADKPLKPKEWVELPDKSKLRLGHAELLFFLPASFVDYLIVKSS